VHSKHQPLAPQSFPAALQQQALHLQENLLRRAVPVLQQPPPHLLLLLGLLSRTQLLLVLVLVVLVVLVLVLLVLPVLVLVVLVVLLPVLPLLRPPSSAQQAPHKSPWLLLQRPLPPEGLPPQSAAAARWAARPDPCQAQLRPQRRQRRRRTDATGQTPATHRGSERGP
jgi:hypothetical protein